MISTMRLERSMEISTSGAPVVVIAEDDKPVLETVSRAVR
jgi:hypothetical protein